MQHHMVIQRYVIIYNFLNKKGKNENQKGKRKRKSQTLHLALLFENILNHLKNIHLNIL